MRWLGLAALIPAVVQPYVTPPPDVLVDDSARVFAVSDGAGHLVLKPGRVGRFVREVWTDRYDASEEMWPKAGTANDALGLSCDGTGCVLARNGQKLLMAFTPDALAEDCGEVDAIISVVAARDLCRDGPIIDIIDLKRDGAHAVWLGKDGVQVRSVKDSTGERIWMKGVPRDEESDAQDD